MRTLRDEAAIAALPDGALRRLLERRVAEIEESCPWDADEVGYFIVVEPGDTADALEAEIGFSVLRNRFDDTPFGHPDFVPSFEWATVHPEVNRPGFCRQLRASYFLSNRSQYEQSTLPRRIQDRGGQTNP